MFGGAQEGSHATLDAARRAAMSSTTRRCCGFVPPAVACACAACVAGVPCAGTRASYSRREQSDPSALHPEQRACSAPRRFAARRVDGCVVRPSVCRAALCVCAAAVIGDAVGFSVGTSALPQLRRARRERPPRAERAARISQRASSVLACGHACARACLRSDAGRCGACRALRCARMRALDAADAGEAWSIVQHLRTAACRCNG